MPYKPLKMPTLPNTTKDLFGSMSSTDALFNPNGAQVPGLATPKPLFEQNVKLSQQSQNVLRSIEQDRRKLEQDLERARQERIRAEKTAERERKKAEKAAAKQQADAQAAINAGESEVTKAARELINNAQWKNIVSNMQRDDEMEKWLSDAEAKLRAGGATDDTLIKAELDAARHIISTDTKEYTKKMKSDRTDPLDVLNSLGKAARTLYKGVGVMAGASDEWTKNQDEAIDAITGLYSKTILLDQANYAYKRSKTKAENPNETLVEGVTSGLRDAWESGNVMSSIVDTVGYIPYAVVGTAGAIKTAAVVGAATGLSGATGALLTKTGAMSPAAAKALGSILSAEFVGAGAASGLFAATDAASGAYDSVMKVDFNDSEQLKEAQDNYVQRYGQANWDNLVKSNGGDMNKVKSELATQAGRDAGLAAFVTTAPLGVLGVESAIAKIGARGVAAQAGKRLLTIGANTVSEALEEGLTQLSQNVGARPVTGVSLTDDVGATAAMGAIAGGGMAAGSQAAAALAESRTSTKPAFTPANIDVNKWVQEGNVNVELARNNIGAEMDNIAIDARKAKLTENDIQQLQQRAYDQYVDNPEVLNRFTPDQAAELKEYLTLAYNINTNDYAQFTPTQEHNAWASNDIEQILAAVEANPHSQDLINAFRVKNNIELDQLPQGSRDYYSTLAAVLDDMATKDTNVTTQEREFQSMQSIADLVKSNDRLTDIQKRSVSMFMMNSMDAGSRRMTNEQQRAYDQLNEMADKVRANRQQVNADGTTEQNQTNTAQPAQQYESQPIGQGAAGENAATVPGQVAGAEQGARPQASNAAAQLAADVGTGARNGNAQSAGNDGARQAAITGVTGDATTPSGTGAVGASPAVQQGQNAGIPQSTPAPASTVGQTYTTGAVGTPSQTGQSSGRVNPTAAQATESVGSTGATQTERNSNGGSNQATTQTQLTAAGQPTTTQQEDVNENQQARAVENSNQTADTGTQNENGTNPMGDGTTSDVPTGEVPSQSGRGDGTGKSRGGDETQSRPVGGETQQGDGSQAQADGILTPAEQIISEHFQESPADKEAIDSYLSQARVETDALPETAEAFVAQQIADGVVFNAKQVQEGSRFSNLPQNIRDIIRKIWDKIKTGMAVVSMALAAYTGSTFLAPQTAMAATPVETAIVQQIVQTNDNQGRQMIVADKQAGTLTVYNAAGQQIASTPALFGKNVGDSVSSRNTTPSGRFDLTRATNINNAAYGSSAQVLTVDGQLQTNNAGHLAIHRVLTTHASENRVGRLESATASDNRISLGCINVPDAFYDAHLDKDTNAVVYVLPETDAGRTGVFAAGANVTPQVQATPQVRQAVSQPVAPTVENITQAVEAGYTDRTTTPVRADAPLQVEGTQATEQVAYVSPTVLGETSYDQMNVAEDIHTPAEQRADGKFDTEPVAGSIRADGGEGYNLYDMAAALASIGAGLGSLARIRRKRMASKKAAKAEVQTRSVLDEYLSNNRPDGGQSSVDEYHNKAVAKDAKNIPRDLKAARGKSMFEDAATRAMWIDYLSNSQLVAEKAADGSMVEGGEVYTAFADAMLGFEWAMDNIMQDKTIEQANDGTFENPLKWSVDIRDGKRVGAKAWALNFAAGATPVFDNLMTEHGVARVGHEMDSSLASKNLAQVKAKASAANSQITNTYLKPVVDMITKFANTNRVGYGDVEADAGRIATVKHVLNEAADGMWKSREKYISERQAQLDAVNSALASMTEGGSLRSVLEKKARQLQGDIQSSTESLNTARDMYNGTVEWDGTTPLPGGYTQAQAQQVLADLQTKYGDKFAQVEAIADETVHAVRGIRNFAAAAGVFSNADLQTFADLGFKEYVPLYSDPNNVSVDHTEGDYTQPSLLDDLADDLPANQARSMGLSKDLSKYHREGAITPAANAIDNLKVFARNIASRVGQQAWLDTVEQLYEGTLGKADKTLTEEQLQEVNASPRAGKIPGLIRVRAGTEAMHGIDVNKLKPINAKGTNVHGERVSYNYYFTEPAIQNEVYSNFGTADGILSGLMSNVGYATRTAARMLTTFKPVWNIYNFARDSLERSSIMLLRPVKGGDGKLVGKFDIAKAYFKNLAILSSNPALQGEVYRGLTTGESKTQVQKLLREVVSEGGINLITNLTETTPETMKQKRSLTEKAVVGIMSTIGDGFRKVGLGKPVDWLGSAVDFYTSRLAETPQVITALAAYMAYNDLGVNKGEATNRVRDQFDPLRVNNKGISTMSNAYPFIRSTFSGHYNLVRSLSEYWKPGTWQAPLAYMTVGILGTMATLTMMSGLFGDDEDDIPLMARLPADTLMNGIPVPVGEKGVWSAPVGFGLNKLLWGIGANVWRQANGYQDSKETLKNTLGLVVDNTSPISPASGNVMAENPVTGMALTLTPLLAKPLMEIATNTKSFGGGKIISRETPKGQFDSDQDNFNVPEAYKTWAKALRSATGIDMRPETIRHLTESYMWGAAGAIPKSILQDQSEKTLGNVQRKGEIFGPFLTAIGADMAIQPNALDYSQQTYRMQDLRMELHRKYGVGETHSQEMYEQYADRGKRGGLRKDATVVTERALRDKGAPEEVIKYVVDGMRYDKERRKMNKAFTDEARKYHQLRKQGKDDAAMRARVQRLWDELELLTDNYVRENKRAYFELQGQV